MLLAAQDKLAQAKAEQEKLVAEQKSRAEQEEQERITSAQKAQTDRDERERLAAEAKARAHEAEKGRLAAEAKALANQAAKEQLAVEEAKRTQWQLDGVNQAGSGSEDDSASGMELCVTSTESDAQLNNEEGCVRTKANAAGSSSCQSSSDMQLSTDSESEVGSCPNTPTKTFKSGESSSCPDLSPDTTDVDATEVLRAQAPVARPPSSKSRKAAEKERCALDTASSTDDEPEDRALPTFPFLSAQVPLKSMQKNRSKLPFHRRPSRRKKAAPELGLDSEEPVDRVPPVAGSSAQPNVEPVVVAESAAQRWAREAQEMAEKERLEEEQRLEQRKASALQKRQREEKTRAKKELENAAAKGAMERWKKESAALAIKEEEEDTKRRQAAKLEAARKAKIAAAKKVAKEKARKEREAHERLAAKAHAEQMALQARREEEAAKAQRERDEARRQREMAEAEEQQRIEAHNAKKAAEEAKRVAAETAEQNRLERERVEEEAAERAKREEVKQRQIAAKARKEKARCAMPWFALLTPCTALLAPRKSGVHFLLTLI